VIEATFWITVGGWMVLELLLTWACWRELTEIKSNCRAAPVVPPEGGFLDIGTPRPK
jgi:hypothetical protein